MIIGKTILAPDSKQVYYSPWFPRGGNGASFTCQFINGANISEFKVVVQTKNKDQSDAKADEIVPFNASKEIVTSTAYGQTTWGAGADLSSTTDQGFLELVRFCYEFTGTSSFSFVAFRMLQPQWMTN